MSVRSVLRFAAALCLMFGTSVARADTITQTANTGFFVFPDQSASIYDIIRYDQPAVRRFDPALGVLTSVTGSISGTFTTTLLIQQTLPTVFELFNVADLSTEVVFGGVNTPSTGAYSVSVTGATTNSGVLASFTGAGGTFLDLRMYTDGAIASSGLTETLTYNYTPAGTPLPAITPEPSSLVLLGTGMIAIVGSARRWFLK